MSKRPVVIDFDDLCDGNDGWDHLVTLREANPAFKATLFAVPTRLSNGLLAKYEGARDWIELGVHGWSHARHECLSWTSEETVEKLRLARGIYPHFAPVFKAPNWETCDEVYKGCGKAGFAIADHIRNLELLPQELPHYVYNLRLRSDPYVRLHGHVQPYYGTGLGEALGEWKALTKGAEHKFVSEVATSGPLLG